MCFSCLYVLLGCLLLNYLCVFFFNDTATTGIYTYVPTPSLPDALPICPFEQLDHHRRAVDRANQFLGLLGIVGIGGQRQPDAMLGEDLHASQLVRSEEHTSELQSLMRTSYVVSFLKKKNRMNHTIPIYQLLMWYSVSIQNISNYL